MPVWWCIVSQGAIFNQYGISTSFQTRSIFSSRLSGYLDILPTAFGNPLWVSDSLMMSLLFKETELEGMRWSHRPTPMENEFNVVVEVCSRVDACWSDSWWKGVQTEIRESGDECSILFYPVLGTIVR